MGNLGVTSVHTVRRTNHMSTTNTPEHGGGFEIHFTENVKENLLINLPSHRRRDRKSRITPLELSQLRALNGKLLW